VVEESSEEEAELEAKGEVDEKTDEEVEKEENMWVFQTPRISRETEFDVGPGRRRKTGSPRPGPGIGTMAGVRLRWDDGVASGDEVRRGEIHEMAIRIVWGRNMK